MWAVSDVADMKGVSRTAVAVVGVTVLLGLVYNASEFITDLAVMGELPPVADGTAANVLLYAYLTTLLSFLCDTVFALWVGYRTKQSRDFAGYGRLIKTVAIACLIGFSVGRALLLVALPPSVVSTPPLSAEFLLVVLLPVVGVTIQFVIAVLAGTALVHLRGEREPTQQQTGAETSV